MFNYTSRIIQNPDGSSRTIDYFELSKQLPYPNFNEGTNKHYFSQFFDESTQTVLDVTDILLNTTDEFEATVKVLNEIDRIKGENVVLTYNPIYDSELDQSKRDMIEYIENYIILHNTPPSSDSVMLQGAKNFVFNSIYNITNSLKNHVAAYSPIAMTDPQNAAANSKEGEKIKKVTNFSPTTKYKLVKANMAGKDGIGISAVGQKVFLAATQYFNQEAKRLSQLPDLTVEDLKNSNLWFSNTFDIYRKSKSLEGKDESTLVKLFTNTIANLNLEETPYVETVIQQAITMNEEELLKNGDNLNIDQIDMVSRNYFQTDKSLVISALISAATDNAKELILDKINANPELMGTYIYLIINGLEFSDIASLMTSDAVSAIKNSVNVNRMYDEKESIDTLLNKIENGISMRGFLKPVWEPSVKVYLKELTSEGVISEVEGKRPKDILSNLSIKDLNNIKSNLETSTKVFTKVFYSEEENLVYQDMLENVSQTKLIKESDEVKKGLLRYIEKVIELKTLKDYLLNDKSNFESFKLAYSGAKEIASLGRVLGINGGAKTKLIDRYSFYKVFNDLLSDPLANASKNLTAARTENDVNKVNIYENFIKYANDGSDEFVNFNFNLERFFNDELYNRAVTEFYRINKHVVNVFDLINKLPHYNAFLKAFVVNENNLKLSDIKYDLLMKVVSNLEEEVMRKHNGTIGKLTDSQFSIISDYIDEIIIKKFLAHENIGIKVKTGDKFFENGELIEATEDIVYNLSSDDGLASFKYYMENTVIPMLKNGYTIASNGVRLSTPVLSRNEFLNKLIVTDKKSKLTGESYQHYRSAVNMLNTTDNIEFDKQITAFGAIENITFNGIKLSNLFLIYDLIINKGRRGQGSLLKILQGSVFNKNSLSTRYFKYIGDVDYNTADPDIKYDKKSDKITISDLNMDDIRILLSPIKDSSEEYTMGNQYVKQYNPETGTYQVQKRIVQQNEKGRKSISYEDINLNQNPNYYLFNSNLNSTFTESVDNNKVVINLVDNVMNLIKTNQIKLIYHCE